MGKRGPQPTPTKVLQLRGSNRAKRRKDEIQVDCGLMVCPPWLNGEAKNMWDNLVPKLEAAGMITELDAFAFARYCLYCVLWLKELSNPGRTEATLDRYASQISRLETSFGMTPSARVGLRVEKKAEPNRFQKLQLRKA